MTDGDGYSCQEATAGHNVSRHVRGLATTIIVTALIAASANADFILQHDQTLDVTASHSAATLLDNSAATVYPGGYIGTASVFNSAFLDIAGSSIGSAATVTSARLFDEATLRLSSGRVSSITARNHSDVEIIGGTAAAITALDNSSVSASGGYFSIHAYDSSKINVSGGYLNYLYLYLDWHAPPQINITGGQAAYLVTGLTLRGIQQFEVSGQPTTDFLAARGLSFPDVTFTGFRWGPLVACNSTNLSVSGGNVSDLTARDNASLSVTGGVINKLSLSGYSTLAVTAGEISSITASDNSSVTIGGGNVQSVSISDMMRGYPDRLTITGGNVGRLTASMIIDGNQQLDIAETPSMSLLSQFGVNAAQDAVSEIISNFYTQGTSILTVSGGQIGNVYTSDASTLNNAGGHINMLSSNGDSVLNMTAGHIASLYANDLWSAKAQRLTIAAGTVDNLHVGVHLDGTQHLELTSAGPTAAWLAPYGVSIAENTVGVIAWRTIRAYDNSSVSVAGSYPSASVYAYDDASLNISSGLLSNAGISGNSTLIMTGGEVGTLTVWHMETTNQPRASITGGIVSNINASTRLYGNEHLSVDAAPTVAQFAQRGIFFTDGTVRNTAWNSIYAHDSSSLEFRNATSSLLLAYNNATISMFSGRVSQWLGAYDSSIVTISGGTLRDLKACDDATITLLAYELTGYQDITLVDIQSGSNLPHYRIFGTGTLTGRWLDGTPWTINITENHASATIVAVPEPATFTLLILGTSTMLLRHRRSRATA